MKLFRLYSKTLVGLCFIVAVYGLLLGAGTVYAQSFVNGGFEADAWTEGWNANVSPTGWVAVTYGDDWPYGVHNSADTTDSYTPFGDQFVALCARDCGLVPPRDSISQAVSGFTVGEQYRLDFQHAAESHDTFASENSIIQVSISDATPASANFSADSVAAGNYFADWKAQSLVFTANATTLTFKFEGVASAESDVESGIDNISVSRVAAAPVNSSIPTLSVYGLLLAILGLVVVAGVHLRSSTKR